MIPQRSKALGAVDVFVTNGTTVTRLSRFANGNEGGAGLNSYDPHICDSGRKVVFVAWASY